jgi:hypothetical protein
MWVFDWLTTSFSSFLGLTFQKKIKFFRFHQRKGEHAPAGGRLWCDFAADTAAPTVRESGAQISCSALILGRSA